MAVEDTLYTFRQHFMQSIQILPICVGILSFFVFAGTFNVAHLFLSLGLLILLPIGIVLLNSIAAKVFPLIFSDDLWRLAEGAQCFFGKCATDTFVTYWLPATAFIITYVFMNAYDLYNLPARAPKDKKLAGEYGAKVAARKAHSAFAMAATTLIGVLLVVWRIYSMADTPLGVVFGLSLGVGSSVALYKFMVGCGLGLRNSDIFGISSRIVATNRDGVACYPVAT